MSVNVATLMDTKQRTQMVLDRWAGGVGGGGEWVGKGAGARPRVTQGRMGVCPATCEEPRGKHVVSHPLWGVHWWYACNAGGRALVGAGQGVYVTGQGKHRQH